MVERPPHLRALVAIFRRAVSLKKAPRSFSPIDDRTPYHVSPPPRPKLKKLVKAMPDLYSTPAEALRIASNIAKLPELLCET